MDWRPAYLSLHVASLAILLAVALGVPLAWCLARRRIPAPDLVSALVTVPMVVPPTVMGYALLLLIGRRSPIGAFLEERFGLVLVFDWPAAVLAGAIAALPLVLRAAQTAFAGVDADIEDSARMLGSGGLRLFWTITLPLAWRGVAAGVVLGFARALGEFGATLMVAGDVPGRTQTLPIAIYDAVQAGNHEVANQLLMLILAMGMLIVWVLDRVARVVPG